MFNRNSRNVLIVWVTLSFLGACAPRWSKPSSVLNKGVPYRADSQNKNVLLYHNTSRKVTAYSKFLIDPVKVVSNETHALTPKMQTLLASRFRDELIQTLKDGYEIVEKPGLGVLRIRSAIQDIQPSHVEFDEDKFLVLRLDTILSQVVMELEGVDSLNGERVVALIYPLYENKYFEKEPEVRFLNIQEAFRVWTRSLRQRLDTARTRSMGPADSVDPQEHRELRFEEGE